MSGSQAPTQPRTLCPPPHQGKTRQQELWVEIKTEITSLLSWTKQT